MSLNIFAPMRARKEEQRRADIYRSLLHYEGRLGGELFGPIPKDVRREFFCLDSHSWVWHEEWTDKSGQRQAMTTRYDIRPGTIIKSQGNSGYQALGPQETRNLYMAIQLYDQRVGTELRRLRMQSTANY